MARTWSRRQRSRCLRESLWKVLRRWSCPTVFDWTARGSSRRRRKEFCAAIVAEPLERRCLLTSVNGDDGGEDDDDDKDRGQRRDEHDDLKLTGDRTGVRGQRRQIDFRIADEFLEGASAKVLLQVDWGDGSRSRQVTRDDSGSLSHVYQTLGDFRITLTATNSEGQQLQAAHSIAIKPADLQGDRLFVGGSDQADRIRVKESPSGKVEVWMADVARKALRQVGKFRDVESLAVLARGGLDWIRLEGLQQLAALVEDDGGGRLEVVGSRQDDSVKLTASRIQLNEARIRFTGISQITVDTGRGDDLVTVKSSATNTHTIVRAGRGDDRVNIRTRDDLDGRIELFSTEDARLKIQGDLNGLFVSHEDTPISGRLNHSTIAGDVNGTVDVAAITNLSIGGSLNHSGLILAHGQGTIDGLSIGGDLDGEVAAPEDGNPDAGHITNVTVEGDLNGSLESGALDDITIGGDLSGSITALEELELDVDGDSGDLSNVTIEGDVTEDGVIDAGAIEDLTVGGDMDGTIIAHGQGTIDGLTIGGDLDGDVAAPEDGNPDAGHISNVTVEGDLNGSLESGALDNITIDGDLSGSIIAVEDLELDVDGDTGILSDVEIGGDVTEDGLIDAGAVEDLTVGGDMDGVILAHGHGRIESIFIGGDVGEGALIAAPEDHNPGSGVIDGITVIGQVEGAVQTTTLESAVLSSLAATGTIHLAGDLADDVVVEEILGSVRIEGSLTGTLRTTAGGIGQVEWSDSGEVLRASEFYVGGAVSGAIVSAAGLAGQVEIRGELSGQLAVQGDVGSFTTTNASGLARFGTVEIANGLSGQIVVGGNIYSDLTIQGALTGRIAVRGAVVEQLAADQIGILGNLTIHGRMEAGSAIISGGAIGDTRWGTQLSVAEHAGGFIAAKGPIRSAADAKPDPRHTIQQATGANAAQIDSVFTHHGQDILFDSHPAGSELGGLELILADLQALTFDPATGRLDGATA